MIKADNLPSIRVAESVGMEKEDEFWTEYYSGPKLHLLYSCSRNVRHDRGKA